MPSNARKQKRTRLKESSGSPASPGPSKATKPVEDPPVAEDATEVVESPADETPVAMAETALGFPAVSVEIPLADPLPSGRSHRAHVDAHLRGAHGATMHRLRDALDKSHARLSDGKVVHTMPDALKWLLEQVEANEAVAPQAAQ